MGFLYFIDFLFYIMQENMDLRKLHNIDEDLTSDEVARLKFLCVDLIPKKRLEPVVDAKDLFLRLEEQALLDDGLLIPELLYTIRRNDLLDILETSKEEVERNLLDRDISSKGVSAYRKMLFSLSEDMTEENLRSVKFLLDLPRAKLGPSATFLDVVIEMEKQQRLQEDNLDELHDLLDKCDKQLACRIEEFKSRDRGLEQGGRRPQQEKPTNGRLSSSSSRPQMETEGENERRESSVDSDSTTHAMIQRSDTEYYSLTQRPLGDCLIINNYNFEEKTSLYNRRGTEKDKEYLARLFHRMHFTVEVMEDLIASDIKDAIMKFANKDHTQMGAFVCCVLSHGEKGAVLGIDGNPVELRELTQPFAKCRSLACKPKLFFIQACQGKEPQNGVWAADGQGKDREETLEEDAYPFISVPREADFLIGMATVEHYQSFRHTTKGSIYIQELCRQLESCCPRNEDILSILTKVNRNVSTQVLKGFKQMPEPRYTLTKKLVLPMD